MPRDPLLLSVRPDHFAEHLAILDRLGTPCHLSALAESFRDTRGIRGGVVITFDDGYLDNLTKARPLLERAGMPATVFVTTGLSAGAFWWDELERLVLAPATVPGSLRLEAGDALYEWASSDGASHDASGEDWNVLTPVRSPRQRLYVELHTLLRHQPPERRDDALAELERWSVNAPTASSASRSLKDDEIVELSAAGLVEIGAHTENHPVLASLPVDRQREEIVRSRRFLGELLGQAPPAFAYPYGGLADYSADTVTILRDSGFSCACTTVPGTVNRRNSSLELPRFIVRDWDGDEFERRIRRLFRD